MLISLSPAVSHQTRTQLHFRSASFAKNQRTTPSPIDRHNRPTQPQPGHIKESHNRTTMTTEAPTPYQPPLTLSSLHHIALTSKSYRVFGLPSEAWQIARHDLKKRAVANAAGCCEDDDFEMMEICNAVCTALQEDAGRYGTAGFHLVRE